MKLIIGRTENDVGAESFALSDGPKSNGNRESKSSVAMSQTASFFRRGSGVNCVAIPARTRLEKSGEAGGLGILPDLDGSGVLL